VQRLPSSPVAIEPAFHGEGPTWDSARGELLWVDIPNGLVRRATVGPDGGLTETAPPAHGGDTVGFVVPDRFHLVYLQFARSASALGLHEGTGSRISMASTAAGAAYTAALSPEVGDAFINDMEREAPEAAKILRPRIEANRQSLREHGYVTACGLWSPHINGLAVPIWSPQYQTFVVITIGLLSAMYDEQRLHAEVAPLMVALGRSLGSLMEGAEGDVFNSRIPRKPVAMAVHNNNKPINSEGVNELEAGTRRARPARSLRAGDGRR